LHHQETDLWEVALFQLDTVAEPSLGLLVHRETVLEDTSPRMDLLQDKGFVPGKVMVLDTVLVRGSLRLGEPSQGNPRVEVQRPGKPLVGVGVLVAIDSSLFLSLVSCRSET